MSSTKFTKRFQIKSNIEIEIEKENKILDKIGELCSYYRERPHEFAKDYLNLDLKPFQKILLYMMFHYDIVSVIACRGIGKSFIIAVYAVIKCILYPNSQVCVTSVKLKQATEVLKKITNDLCVRHEWGSDLLNAEIKKAVLAGQDPTIIFHNGSFIYAVAANQNARSKRSTDNVYDEYVQMNPDIIRDVLVPFLNVKRQCGFTKNPKYKDCVEEARQFFLSSAWYQGEWSYRTVIDHIENMLVEESYITCALPYQLSIESGLLSVKRIKDVFQSTDFNSIKFSMEYEAIWYGSNGSDFFTYENIRPRRTLKNVIPSLEIVLNRKYKYKPPELKFNQERILSLDVALIEGKDNDAAVFMINDAKMNNKNEFIANILYIEAFEGLRTEELGMKVMQLYNKFNCTTLVVDGRGNGQGVLDFVTIEQEDTITGEIYLPFKAVNDDTWSNRARGKKFINSLYVINATDKLNDEAAYRLKNVIEGNKINLPVSEYDSEDVLTKTIKDYSNKNDIEQLKYKKTYVESTLLVNEMINLEMLVGKKYISLVERSGMRKDRYSSLAYNIWVMKELEKKHKPKNEKDKKIVFKSRKPQYTW